MKKLTIALAISFSLLCAAPALAQAPALINYQGKLTDAKQKPVDGPTTILFSIHDAETGGTLLWSQYASVVVKKGIFNAVIGDANLPDALAGSPETWLEVGLVGDYPMTPRQRLVSVAYSIQSKTAQTADDVPGKDITPNSVSITTSPGATKEVINNLGEWTGGKIPSEKLVESDPQVEAKTTNRISKWGGSSLVDSTSINETAGGKVGIGTNAPDEKLSVAGKIQTSEGIRFGNDTVQTTAGVTKEEDPTILPAIKDIIKDGKIDLMTEVQGVHSSLKDGINWDEIGGKPTSFGITEETDPQVKSTITSRIPKWNGSALVDSGAINETAAGNVGIGTSIPKSRLDVVGDAKVSGVLSSGKIQVVDVVTEGASCNTNGLVARNASGLILSCQSGSWKRTGGSATTIDESTGYSLNHCASGPWSVSFKRVGGTVYAKLMVPSSNVDTGWVANQACDNMGRCAKRYSGNVYGFFDTSLAKWICYTYVL